MTLRTLGPYLAPEWRGLALALFSTLAVAVAWIAAPLPIALVVDRLLDEPEIPFELDAGDWRFVGLVGGLVLTIALVAGLGARLAERRLARAGERVAHRLRAATYPQLQRISLSLPENRDARDLVTGVSGDVRAVGGLVPGALGKLALAGTVFVGMLTVSVVIDPLLALTSFAAVPALAYAAMEDRLAAVAAALGAVAVALVLVVGLQRAAAGAVTPGELVIVWIYALAVGRPPRGTAREAQRLGRGLARAERVAEIITADDLLEERPGAFAGPRAAGNLELRDVSFSFDPERTGGVGLTLRVPPGKRLALVGRSDAGRSTLAGLIGRFHDPPGERGQVSLDGRDLRDCSLAWVRDQVGLVLADTVMFTGTVAENIAYGVDASHDQLVAASKAAGAHAFVADLPQGYGTMLGQDGVGLSGGQRQRIAIARTLLRDPPVLVLEEPTAGLDAESEAHVLDGLETLMRDRTTVVVTHSPRLAATVDRVVVVEGSLVVRDGPPELVLPEEQSVRARPAPGSKRPPAPVDRALPRMAELLDSDVMAEVLARSLGDGAAEPDVRLRCLRYRPETNLVVHYDVGVGGRWHHATAMIARSDLARGARKSENVALADMVNGRSPAEHPLFYEPGLRALVQWLPLDLSLWALAVPPAQRDQRLRAAGVHPSGYAEEPALLAYRPRRRAVTRLNGHVLTYHASHAGFGAAVAGLETAAAAPIPTPAFLASIPELLLTVQSHVPGPAVPSPAAAAVEAGAALARLHEGSPGGVRDFPPAEQLERAAHAARLVRHVAPALEARLRALLDGLEANVPDGLEHVAAHGDFNARRLVDGADGLVITDFDAMCGAPAALDVATYLAHMVRGDPADLDEALGVLEKVVEGYGNRPEELSWYLATTILRRSARPFCYQDERWPERVEEMVAAAERAYP
jgi:ABC-type multidrug transport system fused ATPase/permease subunit